MVDDSSVLSFRAFRLRRNWVLPAAAVIVVVGGVFFPLGRESAPLGILSAWIFGWLGVFTVLRNALRMKRVVGVRVANRCLEVDGEAQISSADIVELRATPHRGRGGDVELDLLARDGRSMTLWLRDADASALLRELGIGAGERRARFRIAGAFLRRFLAIFVLLTALCLALALAAGQLSFAALLFVPFDVAIVSLVLAFLIGLFKGTVIVGTDGLAIRWLKTRFVPFADVVSLRYEKLGGPLYIQLRSGKRVRLQAVDEPETDAQRGAQAQALHRHVEEALARFRHTATAAEAAAALRRNDRSPNEWGLALGGIARAEAGGYRVATISAETLLEIATATDGPLDARVGAAAALVRRVGVDDAAPTEDARRVRVAVRVAADSCVEPRARAALEAIAEAGSDVELERALTHLTKA